LGKKWGPIPKIRYLAANAHYRNEEERNSPGLTEPWPRWREFFRWKYPECILPKSFDMLGFDLQGQYRREYEHFLAQTGETGAKATPDED
jgi:hypothetical protein